jgi:hypothetical protein
MLAPRYLLLSLATAVLGRAAQAQQSPPRDTLHLRAAPSVLFSAIAHADTVMLRRYLADDLRWVTASSGASLGKAQIVAAVAHPFPAVSLEYEIDSLHTWQHGEIATADYRLTTRRTFRSYRTVLDARASDVFVQRQGRWELVRHTETWVVQPPATISVDSAALASFVGRYRHGPGFVDDVHFLDGHLVAQSTIEALIGAPGAYLRPVSDDTFSPDGMAPMIVFERDAQGRVTGYVQQEPDGTIIRARRLDAPWGEHLEPARGESGRVRAGARPRATRHATHSPVRPRRTGAVGSPRR